MIMNVFEISYPGFEENPNYSVLRTSETAAKAKYSEYLQVSDAWEIKYIDFLKTIKCKKVGTSTPTAGEPPFKSPKRIEVVNTIIQEIGNRSHRNLYSKKHDRYAKFHWAGDRLWLTDHYTGIPMIMEESAEGKTRDQAYAFSSGGTMWGFMNDFKDYIFGDDHANHNNGYGGLYCPHWGYPEEDMKAIRDIAIKLGYLK